MNFRIRWLCYSKWKPGDAVRAVEDSGVTRGLGARSEAFDFLVHGLVFSVGKSSNQAPC
jgi:hypothetical protein